MPSRCAVASETVDGQRSITVSLPTELFVSHSSRDQAFADAFVATLRAHGLRAWYSVSNLVNAQEWQEQIGLALRRCDWFLVLTSRNAAESMWVRRETMYALNQRR